MWLQTLTESNTSGSSGFDNHGLVSLDSIFINVSLGDLFETFL